MELHRNVDTWERALSVAIGAALVVAAIKNRRTGSGMAMTGIGLLARGATGFCPVNAVTGRGRRLDDTREALGGSRGIKVQEGVTIARPPAEIFALWKDPERLPSFMRDLERVETLDERRSRWVMRGPGGMKFSWDAEIINEVPNELIAWRSLEGADVASAGSVRFRPVRGGTEVDVTLQYAPPGGKAAAALAWLAGRSPASTLREDLRRLKQLLEAGEVPTAVGQPSGHRSAAFNLARWVNA